VRRARQAAEANATTIEKELLRGRLIDRSSTIAGWQMNSVLIMSIDINPDEIVRLASMMFLLRRDGPLRLSRAKRPGHRNRARSPTAGGRESAPAGPPRLAQTALSLLHLRPFAGPSGSPAPAPSAAKHFQPRSGSPRTQCPTGANRDAGLCSSLSSLPLHRRVRGWPFYAFTALHLVLTCSFRAASS
jgi:hypothetical protein